MPEAPQQDPWSRMVASMAASAFAETLTLPTDVAKTRLQVQIPKPDGSMRYQGMLHCLRTMRCEEGTASLWKGLAPALIRQVSYSTLSLVIYEPIRNMFCAADETPGFLQRLAAGGTAGCISISVFNPTEVLKTQIMTAQGTQGLSMSTVIRRVYQADGVLGFWAGYGPNLARTFLVNAAELGTYDQAKNMIVPILGDNFVSHLSASTVAGVVSAAVSTPADVVKTRLMNQAGGAQAYSGMVDAFIKTVRIEGPSALYKGFTPIVVRKVLWCSAFFSTFEQIRFICNSTFGEE